MGRTSYSVGECFTFGFVKILAQAWSCLHPLGMKNWLRLTLACVAMLGLNASAQSQKIGEDITQVAQSFVASLTSEQKAQTVFDFSNPERTQWSHRSQSRLGLTLKAMNAEQRQLAFDLLRVTLSARGFHKIESVRELENLSPSTSASAYPNPRDPELYSLAIFGTPSTSGAWGWRWEGHHLSQNFTMIDGQLVSCTPSFVGINPFRPASGQEKPRDFPLLDNELSFGRALAQSLTPAQRKLAVLAIEVPQDIITQTKAKVETLDTYQGISVADLNAVQKKILGRIIAEYVGLVRTDFALNEMIAISETAEEQIFFTWVGGTDDNQECYFRIRGPSFLLELSNVQGNSNHVHLVWRDTQKDFGFEGLAGGKKKSSAD